MRFVYLASRLHDLLTAYGTPALVTYEQAHHRGGAATEACVGLMATLQAWCGERGINYRPVHTATLKKHARGVTGIATRGKEATLAAAETYLGRPPRDDHEADAVCLLHVPV